jgi:predicted SAM-dependent methyltransferase
VLGPVKRLNLGCGNVIFDGWENADINAEPWHDGLGEGSTVVFPMDIMHFPGLMFLGAYEYIFCNHMLSCFSHHELPAVLTNIRHMLQSGGKVHILVPNAARAFHAWVEDDGSWFPQGDDMPDIDDRLCTFLPWFGESKSIFTLPYLLNMGLRAGFREVREVEWGSDPHDDRKGECLVVEFTR